MDPIKRYITKIARVAQRYASLRLSGTNIGTSEYECIHYIGKNKGISQEKLRDILNIDKAAVARIAANLEKKGYIYRIQDDKDKRAKKLYVTEKAGHLKTMASSVESFFYEWLFEDIDEGEKKVFFKVLDEIYIKSKGERKKCFENILKRDVAKHGEAEN